MSTVNGFQVGNEVLKYNYESLENYNTPNFSTSSSTQYAVGDYVTYQGKLYKCTTATTGGTWVSGSWELAILSDDLQSLGSEVEDLNQQTSDLKSEIDEILTATGLHINPSKAGVTQAISGRQTLISPVELVNGHSYTLTLTLKTASPSICYFYVDDANDTQVTGANIVAGSLTKSKTFTASSNDSAAKITCNTLGEALQYTVILVDNDASDDYVTQNREGITDIRAFTGETDAITFTKNTYINTVSVGQSANPTTQTSLNGCASAYVACNAGDIFTLSGTPRDNTGTRAYMWTNASDTCVFRYDETTALNNLVVVAPYNGYLSVNFLASEPYAVYKGIRDLQKSIIANIKDIDSIIKSPLETLPEYIKNDLAYRPLGQLQNPYLCLTCDDGAAALESYTIPMLLTKNVPCTFGLWSTHSKVGETPVFSESEILRTQTGISAVLSAIGNGCEVAQHGPTEWTEWSEEKLNDFFAREKTAFAELGIDVKGAFYPSHCVNNETRAIVGGTFGSVRSGYRGYKSKYDADHSIPGDVFNPYSYSLTGARSNCYSYTSYNTNDKTLDQLKTALDYAIANNYCMIVYWHDWDLTAEQKTRIEDFIDYAKTTSVNFCTLSEIPTLV